MICTHLPKPFFFHCSAIAYLGKKALNKKNSKREEKLKSSFFCDTYVRVYYSSKNFTRFDIGDKLPMVFVSNSWILKSSVLNLIKYL